MSIRAKAAPRRVMHVDLEPGSLFVMSYATQLHYTHAVPKTPTLRAPLITTVPLQVFAAEVATARGHDVDQPRNLAKSVTVE